MSEIGVSEEMLKRALKEALVEVLEERREFLRDVLSEVLEEFELEEDERRGTRGRSGTGFTLHQGEA